MIRDILDQIPLWFKILSVIFLIVGIASAVYSFKECGTKAFFLGNGAFYAAASGMCEE